MISRILSLSGAVAGLSGFELVESFIVAPLAVTDSIDKCLATEVAAVDALEWAVVHSGGNVLVWYTIPTYFSG